MLTVDDTVRVGDVSTYLSANYNSKQTLFGGVLSVHSPVEIARATDALRWALESNSIAALYSDISLRGVANYIVWLCGRFGLEAQNIIGGAGGGTVVPGGGLTAPTPIEFLVTSLTMVVAGGSTGSFPTFIGFNLLFTRNSVPQSQLISEPTFYTWNSTTGVFTCSPAASPGELFQFNT